MARLHLDFKLTTSTKMHIGFIFLMANISSSKSSVYGCVLWLVYSSLWGRNWGLRQTIVYWTWNVIISGCLDAWRKQMKKVLHRFSAACGSGPWETHDRGVTVYCMWWWCLEYVKWGHIMRFCYIGSFHLVKGYEFEADSKCSYVTVSY